MAKISKLWSNAISLNIFKICLIEDVHLNRRIFEPRILFINFVFSKNPIRIQKSSKMSGLE